MIRNQDFNLQAGGSVPINVEGNYIYFDSATGADQRLRVTSGAGGADVILRPGMDMELPEMQSVIYVQNVGATALSGILIVGVGKVTNRLLSGSVDVSNLPVVQSTMAVREVAARAGRTFGINQAMYPGIARNSYAMLINPVGNARKVYVDRLSAYATLGAVGSILQFMKYEFTGTPAEPNSYAMGSAALSSVSTAQVSSVTDTASTPQVWMATKGVTVAGPGFPAVLDLRFNAGANDELKRIYGGTLVLNPGQLVVIAQTNNAAAANVGCGVFEWWEE